MSRDLVQRAHVAAIDQIFGGESMTAEMGMRHSTCTDTVAADLNRKTVAVPGRGQAETMGDVVQNGGGGIPFRYSPGAPCSNGAPGLRLSLEDQVMAHLA